MKDDFKPIWHVVASSVTKQAPPKKGSLTRKKPLTAKTGLTTRKPLESKSTLTTRKPLTSKSQLSRETPLESRSPLSAQAVVPKIHRPQKRIAHAPSRPRSPDRNPAFLEYVRQQPCDFCGTGMGVEAHHYGKHGMATKCSDYEAVPLCHDHHVEGWHRHGTLPGKAREDWLSRWAGQSALLRVEFEALPDAAKPQPIPRSEQFAQHWREAFHLAFDDVPLEFEPDGPGVSPAYSSAVSSWLWKHVWPLIADRDEWTPVVLWHNGQLYLQAEHAAGGLLDVDDLVRE